MEVYVVSLKRDRRESGPDDWVARIEALPLVQIVGDRDGRSVRVQGPTGTGSRLRAQVGAFCHIEPVIPHHRLSPDQD